MRKKQNRLNTSVSTNKNTAPLESKGPTQFYLDLIEDRDKTEKAFFPGLMKQIADLNQQIEDLHMQVIMA